MEKGRSRWRGPGFEDGVWCNGPEPYPVTGSLDLQRGVTRQISSMRFVSGKPEDALLPARRKEKGASSVIWDTKSGQAQRPCHLPTSQPTLGKSGAPANPLNGKLKPAETPGRDPAAGVVLAVRQRHAANSESSARTLKPLFGNRTTSARSCLYALAAFRQYAQS